MRGCFQNLANKISENRAKLSKISKNRTLTTLLIFNNYTNLLNNEKKYKKVLMIL